MKTENGKLTFNFQFSVFNSTALGIGAASFASVFGTTGFGDGKWGMGNGNGNLGAGRNVASKDIAESPTALAGTPKRKLKVES